MTHYYNDGVYIHVPVSDITTPKDGRVCYTDRWWAVTDNNDVLFFKSFGSPQCNRLKSVVERLGGINGVTTTPVFLPLAYVPQPTDY